MMSQYIQISSSGPPRPTWGPILGTIGEGNRSVTIALPGGGTQVLQFTSEGAMRAWLGSQKLKETDIVNIVAHT